ncbi:MULTISPECIES: hypothetical protein [Burkholderia]|uniref:hypothetical protein n=1 Tax=Burkholderia TaxID=32008 RepID=UPI000B2616E5|nr:MULTISPECIES: hypothetical protein [Burkholderia]
MELKDIFTLVLSGVSVVVSAYTFWLVQFNRGKLKMTRPTYVCLKRDAGPNWPKLFIRTCLYSTGTKGMAVENLFLHVHKDGQIYRFNLWGHTDSGRLTIGSGLFVGPTGIASDHHFNLRGAPDTLLYGMGTYKVEIFAAVAGRRGTKISEIEFDITGQQSAELVRIPSQQLDLYWNAEQERYDGEIRLRA